MVEVRPPATQSAKPACRPNFGPRLRRLLAVLMLLLIVGCSVAVYLLPLGAAELAPLGYLAVFVSTLVAGMAILVPGVNVVVFVAGRFMDPFLVALVGGFGSVLGAGRVGYSYRKFFLATFVGKTLRFLLVALLGGRLLPPA